MDYSTNNRTVIHPALKSSKTHSARCEKGEHRNIPEYAEAIHGEMGRQKGRISELDNDTRAQNASNEADKKYVEAAKWKK